MNDGKCYEIIKKYKCKEKTDILHMIPVYHGEILRAYLRPITFDYKFSMPDIVPTLSRWRRENPTAGTGTFKVTDERTQKWVENFVLKNERRIIFIIQNLEFQYVGHIGLAEINYIQSYADIDAVLRGEKDLLKGIMSDALQTIINWAKNELEIGNIYLDVYSDNLHAIQFYKKHNFREIKRIALEKVIYQNEVKWEISEAIAPDEAEKVYVRMELNV